MQATFGSNRTELGLQVAGAGGVLAVGMALAYTSLKIPLLCPLRAMTGVPCPFCGMTTGVVSILRGDMAGAASANPISFPFFVFAVGVLIERGGRLLFRRPLLVIRRPKPRFVAAVLLAFVVASWVSQLIRFQVFS